MPSAGEEHVTYEAFCPTCEEEQSVLRTVPWQSDACLECGADVDGAAASH